MADIKPTTFAVIYTLSDPRTGEVRYVGWTKQRLELRVIHHLGDARRGLRNHRCDWIRSLMRDGAVPTASVLDRCSIEQAPEREVTYIAALRAASVRLVNGTDGGEGTPGRIVRSETREKMSRTMKGRKPSPRCQEARRIAMIGHVTSTETRARLSEFQRSRSPESREKAAAALRGRKANPEHVAKWVESRRNGNGWVVSEEQKAKIRAKLLGRKASPETRARQSASLKGRTFSPGARARLSAALKAAWVRRKARQAA